MRFVGAYEAKTHLAQLLAEVAEGETITITKHGTPVAQLVPPPDARRPDVAKLIEEWLEYRKEHDIRLDGLTIREMIEEGRRY
jgi:prevent-host-death family protein